VTAKQRPADVLLPAEAANCLFEIRRYSKLRGESVSGSFRSPARRCTGDGRSYGEQPSGSEHRNAGPGVLRDASGNSGDQTGTHDDGKYWLPRTSVAEQPSRCQEQ
jgi:hypothetical protein